MAIAFRTRIVTQDVTPSLNVYYKNTRIKQYHKENRALPISRSFGKLCRRLPMPKS